MIATGSNVALPLFDAFTVAYPDTVTEVFTYRKGGIAGTPVATAVIVYTDSTKASIQSFARTWNNG